MTYGGQALWVANLDDNSISRVDPRTRRVVRTIPTDASAGGIAFGGGSLWVANSDAATISRIDPQYNRPVQTIPVRAQFPFPAPIALAAGAGAVWIVNSSGAVSRLDPARGTVTATIIVGEEPRAIAIGAGAVWVANHGDGTVTRIDPIDPTHAATMRSRWRRAYRDRSRRQARSGSRTSSRTPLCASTLRRTLSKEKISVGRRPVGIAVGSNAVWVANAGDGTVSRIDPQTNEVVKTIPVGSSPSGVAAAAGFIWVTVQEHAPRPLGERGREVWRQRALQHRVGIRLHRPGARLFLGLMAARVRDLRKVAQLPGPRRPRRLAARARGREVAAQRRPPDGKRYTFSIREGFRFSPPSNERVTAATFKYTIERSLSPKLMRAGVAQRFIGRHRGPEGVSSWKGAAHLGRRRSRQQVGRSSSRAPRRISRPASRCRSSAPCRSGRRSIPAGLREIPSAGPYYVSSYTPNEQIVLRRNPNYRGPRPHRLDQIVYTLGIAKARSVAQIEAGQADYAPDGVPPGSAARLAARYGAGQPGGASREAALLRRAAPGRRLPRPEHEPPALRGRQPAQGGQLRNRPAGAGAAAAGSLLRLRRADRPVPSAGHPRLQRRPHLPARRAGRRDCEAPRSRQRRPRHPLQLQQRAMPAASSDREGEPERNRNRRRGEGVPLTGCSSPRLEGKGEPFDIALTGWIADYPDPFNFLNNLLDGTRIKRDRQQQLGLLRRSSPKPEAQSRCETRRARALPRLRRAGRRSREECSAARGDRQPTPRATSSRPGWDASSTIRCTGSTWPRSV